MRSLTTVASFFLVVATWQSARSSDDFLTEGRRAFEKGSLEEAVRSWRAAAEEAHKSKDGKREAEALLDVAAAYERLAPWVDRWPALVG